MNILNTYHELDSHHFDLNVDHFGAEICDKNYSFGPAVRDDYVLHFIIDGKGSFTIDGKTSQLAQGDMFLLPKGKVTFYQADAQHPWSYIWVGFSGSRVDAILRQTQLLDHYYLRSTLTSAILDQMMTITRVVPHKYLPITELQLIGHLNMLLAALMEEFPKKELDESHNLAKTYVKTALNLIHSQYEKPIKVSYLSEHLSLSRSYLYKIFKQETGYSIKDYILQVKMNRSCELLENMDLSITEIALSVGYPDPLNFSYAFKNYFHMSPTDYRKSQVEKD